MLSIFRRFIYILSNKIQKIIHGNSEKLIIDFSKPAVNPEYKLLYSGKHKPKPNEFPINIKTESSYNAYLSNDSLNLGLKKPNCIAWVEIPEPAAAKQNGIDSQNDTFLQDVQQTKDSSPAYIFEDHVIEAKFRLDSFGGYAAAGIIFRIMDEDSYYLALVSSKGYFRLDVVKENAPKTLIAWTEISDFDGTNISMNIITYGTYIICIVNNKWLGETNDNTVAYGQLGFVLASYTEDGKEDEESNTDNKRAYVCKAYLDYISVDTQIESIENNYKKWTDDSNITAESRLRLAETFAVMGESAKALDQINMSWKLRDEAISSITTTHTEIRTHKELLLAARLSFRLEQYKEAEEFINYILEQGHDSAERKFAYTEKLKILNELNKFTELKEFAIKNPFKINKDIDYYTILARCYWHLEEFKDSAEAWDKVNELNCENKESAENGIYAVNAASAHEQAGNKKKALGYYINAGRIFLNQDNVPELMAMMPKLNLLGEKNWEARALAGKWAYSIEEYDKCEKEFNMAEKLRDELNPQPKADPAVFYLLGLVHFLKGKNKTAVQLLEKAVKLAPEYELFRTKLEEIKQKSD